MRRRGTKKRLPAVQLVHANCPASPRLQVSSASHLAGEPATAPTQDFKRRFGGRRYYGAAREAGGSRPVTAAAPSRWRLPPSTPPSPTSERRPSLSSTRRRRRAPPRPALAVAPRPLVRHPRGLRLEHGRQPPDVLARGSSPRNGTAGRGPGRRGGALRAQRPGCVAAARFHSVNSELGAARHLLELGQRVTPPPPELGVVDDILVSARGLLPVPALDRRGRALSLQHPP